MPLGNYCEVSIQNVITFFHAYCSLSCDNYKLFNFFFSHQPWRLRTRIVDVAEGNEGDEGAQIVVEEDEDVVETETPEHFGDAEGTAEEGTTTEDSEVPETETVDSEEDKEKMEDSVREGMTKEASKVQEMWKVELEVIGTKTEEEVTKNFVEEEASVLTKMGTFVEEVVVHIAVDMTTMIIQETLFLEGELDCCLLTN